MPDRPLLDQPTPGHLLAAALLLLALWVVHDFAEALLAAGVTAVASWPLYERFQARLPGRVGGAGVSAGLFTLAITVLVLAPLVFAAAALLGEARLLLIDIAVADGKGILAPAWLLSLPIVGPWLGEHLQSGALHTLAHSSTRKVPGSRAG